MKRELGGLSIRGGLTVALSIGLGVIGILNLQSTGLGTRDGIHLGQALWLAMGAGVMGMVALTSQRTLKRFTPMLYGGTIVLLVVVLVIVKVWFSQMAGRVCQYAAIGRGKDRNHLGSRSLVPPSVSPRWYTLRDLVPVGVIRIAYVLVLQEPDLGHTLVFFIGGSMLLYEKFDQQTLIALVVWRDQLVSGIRTRYKKIGLTLLDRRAVRNRLARARARGAVGSGGIRGKWVVERKSRWLCGESHGLCLCSPRRGARIQRGSADALPVFLAYACRVAHCPFGE